jgi:hypothetical protein
MVVAGTGMPQWVDCVETYGPPRLQGGSRSAADHHEAALAVRDADVVSEAVALASRPIPTQADGALTVEVRGNLIGVEVVEYRPKILTTMKLLTRLRIATIHEDNEVSVLGEERDLLGRIATIGAMGVCVDQLTNRQPIGGLFARETDVIRHELSLLGCLRSKPEFWGQLAQLWLCPGEPRAAAHAADYVLCRRAGQTALSPFRPPSPSS